MKDTAQTPLEQFRIGLILRVGSRSWFWGRGTPLAAKPADATSQARLDGKPERWSGLGEWLRHMHAADRAAAAQASTGSRAPAPEQGCAAKAAAPDSGSARRVRLVCSRRVIGLLIN